MFHYREKIDNAVFQIQEWTLKVLFPCPSLIEEKIIWFPSIVLLVTLIGTGKTVTGVHIAYWFAQMNKKRSCSVQKDGEECSGFMVFYCGPSNKSVDVVARMC